MKENGVPRRLFFAAAGDEQMRLRIQRAEGDSLAGIRHHAFVVAQFFAGSGPQQIVVGLLGLGADGPGKILHRTLGIAGFEPGATPAGEGLGELRGELERLGETSSGGGPVTLCEVEFTNIEERHHVV